MKKILIWVFSILLVCLTGIGLYWGYFILHWTDHLVDKNVIAGVKTNNSYGIRNEVYDFLIKEEFVKYNMNQEQKNLLLNTARYNQLLLENFDNIEKIIEIYNQYTLLLDCEELYKWQEINYAEDFYGPSKYRQIMAYQTKDHEIAFEYYNQIVAENQTKIKNMRSYSGREEVVKKFCDKHKKEVSND